MAEARRPSRKRRPSGFRHGAAALVLMVFPALILSNIGIAQQRPPWADFDPHTLNAWRAGLCPTGAGQASSPRRNDQARARSSDELNRAQDLMAEGKLRDVKVILCDQLALRSGVFGITDPRTISVLNSFGVFLRKRGEFGRARRLLEDLDIIAAKYPPEGQLLRRAILQNLGTALYSQGYWQASEAAYERVLAIVACPIMRVHQIS